VWIILQQNKRTFVEKLHFVTSAGHQPRNVNGPATTQRTPIRGRGPTVVITDLGILVPDPATSEFTLVSLHPGVTVDEARAATGWDLKVSDDLEETLEPTAIELGALRDLHARTAAAHGSASTDD
jgi:glutaconate CoA-transferase subunit B